MSCLSTLEYSVGLSYWNFLSEKQLLAAVISLRQLSRFTQTSSESKKIDMAKDLIFDSSVFMHFFVQKMCKHTLGLT